MVATAPHPSATWEKLPADFVLPDDPVDNIHQPPLTTALTERLQILEFLSDTEGGEYSSKATYPPGKFFFYEQILHVPSYGIFEPETGSLELHRLNPQQRYQLAAPDAEGRYWLPELNLFLGVWQGTRENREGYWLRWWNEAGELLLWGSEKAEQEQQRAEAEFQRAEQERERAEVERQRVEQLMAQLKAAGVEPEVGEG